MYSLGCAGLSIFCGSSSRNSCRLDNHAQGALGAHLRDHVPGFPRDSQLTVHQFAHGQSNPTYLLQVRCRSVCHLRPAQLDPTRRLCGT